MTENQTASLAPELQYKEVSKLHPTYRMDQLIQRQGGSLVPVGGTSVNYGMYSLFELPIVAFNLSKSILTVSFTAAPGAAGAVASNVFLGMIPQIARIQFYTKGNAILMDLENFSHYTKIIFNSDIKLKEMLEMDSSSFTTAIFGTSPIQRCNQIGAAGTINRMRIDTNPYTSSYTESRPVISTAGGATTLNLQINLGLIKNSILALDKDLYFDEVTYLKIYWNSYTNFGYADTLGTGVGVAALGVFTLSNVYLYLAVEANDGITSSLRELVNSPNGMDILMDYTTGLNFPLQSTLQNFSVFVDDKMGMKLKRIYWAPFQQAPANASLLYDTANVVAFGAAAPKILQIVTRLDNVNIIQNPILTNMNQDYLIMKDKIKDSVLQDLNGYQTYWFWCDSWDGMPTLTHHDPNLDSGLPLIKPIKYDVILSNGAPPNAFSYYTFVVTLRKLIIKKNSVQVI